MVGMGKKHDRYHPCLNFSAIIFLIFIPLLGAVLFIYGSKSTTDLIILSNVDFSQKSQVWLFIAFFVPFVTMMMVFPFHKWILDQPSDGEIGTLIMLTCIRCLWLFAFLNSPLPNCNQHFRILCGSFYNSHSFVCLNYSNDLSEL